MPVTYADVWEFWLRHRDVAAAVDFITIHILPYWEDHPIPVGQAARHVDRIRQQIVDAFPGKEVFLGEFGWPSAGRMREGALPSPVNAARVLHEVVALGKRENYRVNLIEAYDQPWKRKLEGTVGGHWGLFDAYERRAKFAWGGAVSNHPNWRWQAAGGVGFAALVFVAALAACWLHPPPRASMARRCGYCRRVRNADRLDDRERADRESDDRRLGAFAGLGCGRARSADSWRGGAHGVRACPTFASMLGRRAETPRGPLA